MYRIIGGDGKEYGPASAEVIRGWIRDGRANAQTRACAEGGTEWRTLGEIADFSAMLAAANPPPPLASSRTAAASNRIAAGVCGILLGSLGIHKFILGYTNAGLIMLLVTVLTCGLAGAVVHVIGLIEGIIYLCKSDEEFIRTYVTTSREWF